MTHRWSAAALADLLGLPTPTDEQRAVIEAPLEPLLVVAGAGSGKTETMTSRVVWLVANDLVAPDQVLGLTFTRKAANELADRVTSRLAALEHTGAWAPVVDPDADAEDLAGVPTVSTYHSYAGRLVRDHALRLGYERDSRLLSEAAAWQLAHEAVLAYDGPMADLEKAESTVTQAVLALAGEMAEHLLTPEDVAAHLDEVLAGLRDLQERSPKPFAKEVGGRVITALHERRRVVPIVSAYLDLKRARSAMDFADQMALAARLARSFPEIGAAERDLYRVVLLDEFQDTSEAQLVLIRELFAPTGAGPAPVTAVGDPNQSIYAWRGASATTLGTFPEVFATDGYPAPVLALSTSWRNDSVILDAANTVAAPLREGGAVPVPPLHARPGAPGGQVWTARVADARQEAVLVADWVAQRRGQGASRRTAAVLCRKRSQFPAIVEALAARGIPYEVVGVGGLLATSEVVDLVALLTVVQDPARGDRLMRLLTGPVCRLGAADLAGLQAWARELAPPRPGDRRTADISSDAVDALTIVDALADLPADGWVARSGAHISSVGLQRLRRLAAMVRRLRSLTALPLADLVGEAERTLGVDIEVMARPGWTPGAARAHLDAFADVAAQFSAGADRPTLGGFLDWLEAALTQERGLEAPTTEISPDAVQVLTCHAAKGLEWDVVAVPGMLEGVFPAHNAQASWRDDEAGRGGDDRVDDAGEAGDGGGDPPPTGAWKLGDVNDSAWLTGLGGGVPYPLRGDRGGLPEVSLTGADATEVEQAMREFKAAAGAHGLLEERRLAYVAFTRARHQLLVSSAVWAATGKIPRLPSRFQEEIVVHAETLGWAEMPPKGTENPLLEAQTGAVWPAPTGLASEVRGRLAHGGQLVTEARAAGAPPVGDGAVDEEITMLLAERDAVRRPPSPSVALPAHLSTSALVSLVRDRDAFAMELRRPMPQPPQLAARRGTTFHAWVEQHYAQASIVDVLDLPGSADDDLPEAELETLQANFRASEWAGRVPQQVELSLETVVAGQAVRGRVDAVFADGDGVVVVDWKTGRPPGPAEAATRAVQLSAYRLAYARLTGMSLGQVRAAFFYAATGETVWPELLDEAELQDLVSAAGGSGDAVAAE